MGALAVFLTLQFKLLFFKTLVYRFLPLALLIQVVLLHCHELSQLLFVIEELVGFFREWVGVGLVGDRADELVVNLSLEIKQVRFYALVVVEARAEEGRVILGFVGEVGS